MVFKNFYVEKNGKRYQALFKLFFEVLLLWGGFRIVNFVVINFGGFEIYFIYRWYNQYRIELDGDIKEINFKQMSVFYKKVMVRGKVDFVFVKTRQVLLVRFYIIRERISYLDFAELKELSINVWIILQSLLEMERKVIKVSLMYLSSVRSVYTEELFCLIFFI